jgi:hypothetical protein
MSDFQYNSDRTPHSSIRKPYAPMRVARLGGFSDLTQQMAGGSYNDMMGGLMVMMRRRR